MQQAVDPPSLSRRQLPPRLYFRPSAPWRRCVATVGPFELSPHIAQFMIRDRLEKCLAARERSRVLPQNCQYFKSCIHDALCASAFWNDRPLNPRRIDVVVARHVRGKNDGGKHCHILATRDLRDSNFCTFSRVARYEPAPLDFALARSEAPSLSQPDSLPAKPQPRCTPMHMFVLAAAARPSAEELVTRMAVRDWPQ